MGRNVLLHMALAGQVLLFCGNARSQADTLLPHYLRTITADELRAHLEVIASDAYEGRETGRPGQKMAATYLRNAFMRMGIPPVPDWRTHGLLEPGYEQPFALELVMPGVLRLVVDGKEGRYLGDHFYFQDRIGADLALSEVVFMGLGERDQQRNDYEGIDVKGKAVLVLEGEQRRMVKDAVPENDFFTDLTRKTSAANAAGARVMLYVSPNADLMMKEYAHYLGGPRMRLKDRKADDDAPRTGMQVVVIDQETAARILAKGGIRWKKVAKAAREPGLLVPCPIAFNYRPEVQQLQAENVLGFVEGTDLRQEVVLVTAHYDHIGADGAEVYNGADDDGSGTVALLEMAQAFALAKAQGHGPRRSLLFMPVSGEEKGLLGSEYYSDHPVFPLDSTVADLNIDMIGRTDTAHTDSPPYVYIIGSDRLSSELHRINEEANTRYTGLQLDYTFNAPNDPNRFYYRSDHYNFARYGVPVIFYFSGVHEDYHQPGDEVQKIRFDLLEARARLVFATAWELANRPARIVVDKPVKEEERR